MKSINISSFLGFQEMEILEGGACVLWKKEGHFISATTVS